MNKRIALSLLLIGVGVVLVALSRVKFEKREEVFRVGDFRATTSTAKTVPALRYVGYAALAGGVIVLLPGLKKH